MDFREFLKTSYSPYHAVANAESILNEAGFTALDEGSSMEIKPNGAYYIKRGGSVIAFRTGSTCEKFRVIASHTDSPCLKLKEHAADGNDNFTRLNTEPYGGGLWYSFFDRPLKIAGRVVREKNGKLVSENYESTFNVVLPSLAIHQNRDANEKFAPNLQTELPLLSLGKTDFEEMVGGAISYDLFAAPDAEPFVSGVNGEFLSSPRLDNLSSAYTSLVALIGAKAENAALVCACLEAEEIGSRTRAGAGGDFLRMTLERIAAAFNADMGALCARSLLISLDNAHSLHPNHPEKCDPTNRAVMGKGIVIKGHAGGAYTTDAMTAAVIKTVLTRANVPYQTFYNRSDMRSGSTLGAISLSQVSMPSVDLGLAQLAMHSAVETMALADLEALENGLAAFYKSNITLDGDCATIE